MLHQGSAALGFPAFFALVALLSAAGAVVSHRVKARRWARGRERRLWFDYATLAARTAREMRGELL